MTRIAMIAPDGSVFVDAEVAEYRHSMRLDGESVVSLRSVPSRFAVADLVGYIYDWGKTMGLPVNLKAWALYGRIALNYDQIEEYELPPNPTKLTDSRAGGYLEQYGSESWELDALDPRTLDDLIETHIEDIVDRDLFDAASADQEDIRRAIQNLADVPWSETLAWLDDR